MKSVQFGEYFWLYSVVFMVENLTIPLAKFCERQARSFRKVTLSRQSVFCDENGGLILCT